MAKFGINDILNAKTKAAGQQAQTDGYKEIYLSPYEVKAAQENTHQKLENIEELADSFLHVGQEQPTVLARVNGEYRIIDGHRRNAANILNLERGHKEYEKVLYRFMDMSEAMYELRLLAGNGYTQELTAYCFSLVCWLFISSKNGIRCSTHTARLFQCVHYCCVSLQFFP